MASNKFELFPEPSLLPLSPKYPPRLPGVNRTVTEALMEILKENHEKWHIFFDDVGRHNHITHQILAQWAFGAHQDLLRASYAKNIPLQRPMPEIPETITPLNFNDHLGDKTYYAAYLAYFDDIVRERRGDVASLLEEFIYSPQANFGSKSKSGEYPQMACRFLELVVHPIIHVGYAAEFGIFGMLSEGLAETAVHPTPLAPVIPQSLFSTVTGDHLSSEVNGHSSNASSIPVHAFTVVARILADPQFKNLGSSFSEAMPQLLRRHSAALTEYACQWTIDIEKLKSDPKEIDRKIEELQWTNTMLYAVPGYKKGEVFNADFFYMHLVTSALFLPVIAANLSAASQALLLRTYFIVSLTWWVSNGRPELDIASFMHADDEFNNNRIHPRPGPMFSSKIKPHDKALSTYSDVAANPNPWLYMTQQACVHPDDHLPKILRALSHFALLYGTQRKGEGDLAKTELTGAEELDGSLFVRAAGLTVRRLEEIQGDEYSAYWDRPGFFENVGAGGSKM